MFRLLQSNDMHTLVETFARQNEEQPKNPFKPLTVVVQSFGMGQWLKLQLAERAGISANIDCLLPANLIWQLYQNLLPDFELPTESPYSIERMTWILMRILPDCSDEEYAQVQQFLAGSGDRQVRAYQLAEKIATLYDQYLIYRPDWITGWEAGREDVPTGWQRDLWRRLVADPSLKGKPHRANLHRKLIDRLSSATGVPDTLPGHLSVFGLSSLPVIYLQTMQLLARHIDIDLYFLNPSQHYWGDIVSEKDVARRSLKRLLGKQESLDDEDYLEVGNPLLSSLGKQGREYLELLLEIDDLEADEAFIEPTDDTMLSTIKRDILNLEFGGEFGMDARPAPKPVAPTDISVQIHSCHSKMREVEVLYDQLLRYLDHNPHIRPADIIVMMPEVGDYAPFIEAVFQDKLHYAIADRSLNQESAVLVAFSTLLGLADMRLSSTEVMDLLEVPTVARRFNLNEDDLLALTFWISDSGIRWELTGESREVRWHVPANDQNTWQFGLDRLLLGVAMESDAGPFSGILPMDVAAADAELLGTLCHVVEQLASYRRQLTEAKSMDAWRETILNLLDDFFEPMGQEELDLGLIRELLIRLEEEIRETGFDEQLTPRMLRYWFDQQLSVSQQSRGFITGGITFATLVPMRSIPFKVVCLLGMNDAEYPRQDRPPTFDLMQSHRYRRGDRSKRNDDRYLFLEALLSAEQFFYVSYEGRSVKDNQERPPSVLVSELIDYMSHIFDSDIITVHPLQPFSEEYYDASKPGLVTYRTEWYDALLTPLPVQRFADVEFEDDPDLAARHINQLIGFFRHPARSFLRNRLGVYFEEEDIELLETESFTLDGLARYQLADTALTTLLQGESIERWRQRSVASGFVMEGPVGQAHLDRELTRAEKVFAEIEHMLGSEPEQVHDVLLLPDQPGGLEGIVDHLYGETILNYRAGTLRMRQVMEAWIRHLFVNAVRGKTHTMTISTDRDKIEQTGIEPLDTLEAKRQLVKLIDLYHRGLRSPLPFLPETSYEFIKEQSFEKALQVWHRDAPGSEGVDRHYCRLFEFPRDFDENFKDVAEEIFLPLLEHWSDKK